MKTLITALTLTVAASSVAALPIMPFFPQVTFPETDSQIETPTTLSTQIRSGR